MTNKIFKHNDNEIADIRSIAEYDISERRVYGIIQDVSHQKKTDFELKVAIEKANESDRLKSAFVSNMSHEIRTPMNGIVGFAHLLTDTEPDIDEKREYKEGLHLCCNQLLSRVNDILDIAKIESGQIIISTCQVNIDDILKDILQYYIPAAKQKKLDIRLNDSENTKRETVLTDIIKLNKILMSLIDNAIRFTPCGYVEFGYKSNDKFLEFFVTDTGIGISADHQEIIFQPFCQANTEISQEFGGTGLGLTIAKTYVQMLGGKIWLESKPGAGSTFFFTIPVKKIEEVVAETVTKRKKLNRIKNCLIVEDLEMNYNYLKALLVPLGFNILWAKDGTEGIKIAISNNSIDLVLMDIRMPDIDGYTATKIIKENRPDLPIIAQSANVLSDERKRAIDAGCNHYLTKPIYKEELKTVLNDLFEN
jgi:signal transduction histidine kinase/CheY-like chemotaxis protein